MNTDIYIKNISYTYDNMNLGENFALSSVSLSLKKGSFNVLVGRSGCGKSTVLRIVAGILKPDYGEVNKPDNVSMVFQGGALLPWRTVEENVGLAFEGKKKIPKSENKIIEEELSKMKILAYKDSYPHLLSGGEKQRVGIARALVVRPELLLLDEPFSALDAETTRSLHLELISIWKRTGMTILMVSHSVEEAVSLADNIIVMKNGKIKEEIKIGLERPRDESQNNFISYINTVKRML